jgi:hypothetical protein
MNAKDRKLIDDYLSDKMDEKATAVLKARLKKDSDLKCELELQQGINDAIQQKDVTAFTGKIQNSSIGQQEKEGVKSCIPCQAKPIKDSKHCSYVFDTDKYWGLFDFRSWYWKIRNKAFQQLLSGRRCNYDGQVWLEPS